MTQALEETSSSPSRRTLPRWAREDWAYLLPMFSFLALIWLGTQWPHIPWVYPASYLAREIVATALLIWLWPRYTRIRWDYWWLGLLLGILGIVQWVGMQLWLQKVSGGFPAPFNFSPSKDAFNPHEKIASPVWLYAFFCIRVFGAVIIVPVMEELFWRDYLWRRIVAPNDFRLAKVGEWDWKAFVAVPIVFATVHGNWWLTAIIWAFMIGGLMAYTKSLGACIVMHATTNALLAAYVLYTGDWSFW
jgi:CAAX prenyl protease-like protein